jgi:hypothetical protein
LDSLTFGMGSEVSDSVTSSSVSCNWNTRWFRASSWSYVDDASWKNSTASYRRNWSIVVDTPSYALGVRRVNWFCALFHVFQDHSVFYELVFLAADLNFRRITMVNMCRPPTVSIVLFNPHFLLVFRLVLV